MLRAMLLTYLFMAVWWTIIGIIVWRKPEWFL